MIHALIEGEKSVEVNKIIRETLSEIFDDIANGLEQVLDANKSRFNYFIVSITEELVKGAELAQRNNQI